MIVACLRVRLHLPGCTSLKQKRFVIKSLKDRMRNKFNVALCEYGYQDKWQFAELGIVTAAGTRRGADRALQAILNFLERERKAVLADYDREIF